jgi:hypothetical protein
MLWTVVLVDMSGGDVVVAVVVVVVVCCVWTAWKLVRALVRACSLLLVCGGAEGRREARESSIALTLLARMMSALILSNQMIIISNIIVRLRAQVLLTASYWRHVLPRSV